MHTITRTPLTERLAGAWLIAKSRTQQRTHDTQHAARALRKQGCPVDLAVLILARGTK